MWEQLSSAGVQLSDKEKSFMRSLPSNYATFVSQLFASAHMTGNTIDPETLIVYLLQEFDLITISTKRPGKK
ncbi:hypothetical protein SERLA73DRAFT_144899 [Serpula lacrymans var. lacrymans S7.3]|uniref:Uncharacterized protein n=1 Tax=Serpula lacrymans var. lacrymans (strain S7.3) TaxID=936435 RepID=F8QCL4_SERL3|nr:hypothetical protein SERLA73DRAFT_144899 [Serpula lacrymans var. lacrymans S7.3]